MIATAVASATAVFQLAARATAIATPAATRVESALARMAEAEKAAPDEPEPPSNVARLGRLAAREKEAGDIADAVQRDVDVLTRRIGDLIGRRGRRVGSGWFRLFAPSFSEIDAEIARLKADREALKARFAREQSRHFQASARHGHAVLERKRAIAAREGKRQASLATSAARLAVVERARGMLRRVPVLASLGLRMLLQLSIRVGKVREQGWDPGFPSGPGT